MFSVSLSTTSLNNVDDISENEWRLMENNALDWEAVT